MGTIAADLDWCQAILGDARIAGLDGLLWSRADLLRFYNDGYRRLLTLSQAVRRFTILEVPGRFTGAITQEWEAQHMQGGSFWKWTWTAGAYECSSLWEVQFLGDVTPQAASEGVTQQWERVFVNPLHQYYRFALPQDNERIAAVWYDHRRLMVQEVRELDALERHWMSLGSYPLAWTQGVGRTGTFEVYEIVTTSQQGYSQQGGPFGIPRRYTGSRTYGTAGDTLYGIPRTLSSPDRQYLATMGTLGLPRTYQTSNNNLLVLEVIGPEVPDMLESDTPRLLPPQMQKYLRYFTLAEAWGQQGEGAQPALSAICQQLFQRGGQFLKGLSWLTRKDEELQRLPRAAEERYRPPRVRLPATYPRT